MMDCPPPITTQIVVHEQGQTLTTIGTLAYYCPLTKSVSTLILKERDEVVQMYDKVKDKQK